MTPAMRGALKWLKDRGGSAAVAKTNAKGRIYLAQGETGPFEPRTVKALCDEGYARYLSTPIKKNVRVELTDKGLGV